MSGKSKGSFWEVVEEEMKLKEINKEHYLEDALLTWRILDIIKQAHDLDVEKVYRHVNIMGKETDAVAICRTILNREERWVGFELKESDILKAFVQANLRRRYFDYFYIIINLKVEAIVDFILKIENFKNYNVGIVSAKENVLVYASRFQKRTPISFEKKREVNQLSLIKFLHENVER